MKRIVFAAAALGLAAAPAFAQDFRMQPGEWENTTDMTMTMTMNGQTMNFPVPAESTTECVTEEDATFDPESLADESCTVSEVQQSARSLSFKMTCVQDGTTMAGKMDATLNEAGTEVNATMTMAGTNQQMGGQMTVKGDITSRRIGDCQG